MTNEERLRAELCVVGPVSSCLGHFVCSNVGFRAVVDNQSISPNAVPKGVVKIQVSDYLQWPGLVLRNTPTSSDLLATKRGVETICPTEPQAEGQNLRVGRANPLSRSGNLVPNRSLNSPKWPNSGVDHDC